MGLLVVGEAPAPWVSVVVVGEAPAPWVSVVVVGEAPAPGVSWVSCSLGLWSLSFSCWLLGSLGSLCLGGGRGSCSVGLLGLLGLSSFSC